MPMVNFYSSVELNASSGHAFRTPEPASEELHDGHHFITIARHAIAALLPVLDLDEFESVFQLRDSTIRDCRRP